MKNIREEIDNWFDNDFKQVYLKALKDSFNLVRNTEDEFVKLVSSGNLTNKQLIETVQIQESNQRLKLDIFEKLNQLYKDAK